VEEKITIRKEREIRRQLRRKKSFLPDPFVLTGL
jgi:hypothetical protein